MVLNISLAQLFESKINLMILAKTIFYFLTFINIFKKNKLFPQNKF